MCTTEPYIDEMNMCKCLSEIELIEGFMLPIHVHRFKIASRSGAGVAQR